MKLLHNVGLYSAVFVEYTLLIESQTSVMEMFLTLFYCDLTIVYRAIKLYRKDSIIYVFYTLFHTQLGIVS